MNQLDGRLVVRKEAMEECQLAFEKVSSAQQVFSYVTEFSGQLEYNTPAIRQKNV